MEGEQANDIFVLWSGSVRDCILGSKQKRAVLPPKQATGCFRRLPRSKAALLSVQDGSNFNQRGACIGSESLFLGDEQKKTFVTSSSCVFCKISRKALFTLMYKNQDLIYRIAARMAIEQKSGNEGVKEPADSPASEIKVIIRIRECVAIPSHLLVKKNEFDPICVLKMGGQQVQTLSQR